MKALRPFPLGLARLLSRHPPATGFSWPCRIADVQDHMDGPGVTGTRDGFHEFRILRIGNVHDAPAVMPQMPHVEIPMAIDLLNGHLEGALAVVESAISDGLHVVGFPSRWDGIGVAARRQ